MQSVNPNSMKIDVYERKTLPMTIPTQNTAHNAWQSKLIASLGYFEK